MPSRRSIHRAKWHRCIRSAGRRGKRRRNPAPTKFFIFLKWTGRTWLHYDGENFSITRQAKPFATPGAAWKVAERLRREYPTQLRKRVLYVSDKWPTKI